MQYIEKCNICRGRVKDKLELPFNDIVGMAEEYTQKIAICPECGFIFTRNPFDTKQLDERYKHFSKFEFDSDKYILSEKDDYKVRCIRQQQFIERNIGLDKISSLLEVGASSGYNLSLYSSTCNVKGIEPSNANCINAKRNYGLDMYCGTFAEFRDSNSTEKYDLLFMSHVLEHIVNPKDFIRQCSELNTSYIFIEVPTLDYKFMDEPYGMFCEEHVNMFTLESLDALMCSCGYELINADMIMGVEQSLPAGWPALSTIWIKKESPHRRRIVNSSEKILDDYIIQSQNELERIKRIISTIDKNKKLAIWGTGHHASMLMANTSLMEKNIVKVYDSDEKKQGCPFGACKIEKFNEEDIVNKKVELILIATYTAQKAILNILKKCDKEVQIITLYS